MVPIWGSLQGRDLWYRLCSGMGGQLPLYGLGLVWCAARIAPIFNSARYTKCMNSPNFLWHCLGVRYRIPRLRGYGSGTGHRATPMRTVSGSGSLLNNYSARLGIRGCVSVPARICSNCYFTNKNSWWSLTLLRPPSLIICIYCHAIQTSISLYKRYKIFNGRE